MCTANTDDVVIWPAKVLLRLHGGIGWSDSSPNVHDLLKVSSPKTQPDVFRCQTMHYRKKITSHLLIFIFTRLKVKRVPLDCHQTRKKMLKNIIQPFHFQRSCQKEKWYCKPTQFCMEFTGTFLTFLKINHCQKSTAMKNQTFQFYLIMEIRSTATLGKCDNQYAQKLLS